MSDDLFSQLFNLFNNDDGDVNWQLAEQINNHINKDTEEDRFCLLYTSPSPRDRQKSRMPSSA